MTLYRVRLPGARPYEDVAQVAEHLTFNQRVVSSNLTIFTIYPIRLVKKPRGYGPRIEGLNPSWGTIYGLLFQFGRETWLRTMTVWVQIPGDPPSVYVSS